MDIGLVVVRVIVVVLVINIIKLIGLAASIVVSVII